MTKIFTKISLFAKSKMIFAILLALCMSEVGYAAHTWTFHKMVAAGKAGSGNYFSMDFNMEYEPSINPTPGFTQYNDGTMTYYITSRIAQVTAHEYVIGRETITINTAYDNDKVIVKLASGLYTDANSAGVTTINMSKPGTVNLMPSGTLLLAPDITGNGDGTPENDFAATFGTKTVVFPNDLTDAEVEAYINAGYPERLFTADPSAPATSGTCGTNLNWSYDNHVLTISGTGTTMSSYTSAGAPWYAHRANITSIVLPSGLTNIGAYAFEGCAISSVTLPANVASIGDFAFSGCTSLSQVTINNSNAVVSLSQSPNFVFMNCNGGSKLTGIVPHTLLSQYKNDTNLSNPWRMSNFNFEPASFLGDACGASMIWSYANHTLTISGTGAMTNYTNASLPGWDDYKEYITSVVISEGVTSIGNYAFYYDQDFTSISLPSSLISIGEHAFDHSDALTSITIPSGVTVIPAYMSIQCDHLQSVTFQGNISSIGDYAFQGCTALNSISLPNSLTTIGDGVFNGATFASISIPASVETIGEAIFHTSNGSGDGLTIVLPWTTIPDGIDERAFDQDPANAYESFTISIPDGAEICDYTDKFGTTKKVYKNSSEDNLTCDATPVVNYNCGANLTWAYSNGVLTISGTGDMTDYAAYTDLPWVAGGVAEQTDITSVVLPSGMTRIGNQAFVGCTNLTSIVLPNSLASIGSYAFGNSGLTAVTIPASVTDIGQMAFMNCANLSTVTLLGTTPPTLDAFVVLYTFYKAQNPVETFYVPEGRKATYLAANGWNAILTDANTKEVVAFADGENTTSKLTNGSHEMIIINRNVQRNGFLNTLCLPFAMNETQIANSSLADAVIYEFSGVTQVNSDFELTLTPVTTIEAGKPYFFKYEMNEAMLTELIFRDVTVSTNEPQAVGPFDNFTLKGTLSTQEVEAVYGFPNSTFIYSLGAANTLYCVTSGTQTVYPLRAYFEFNFSMTVINYAPAARISFGHNTATDVENVQDAAQGTKVIENGQVVIIRNGARYNVAGQLIK